jgi:hypothetical protein
MAFGNHDYTTIYRDAATAYATHTVAALAGSLRRAGLLDDKALVSCEELLKQLERVAHENPRGDAVHDAAVVRALYADPEER